MSALRAATPAPSGTTKKVGKWLDILHVSESARKDRKELIYLLLKCIIINKAYHEDNQPHCVIPGLFIGSVGAAARLGAQPETQPNIHAVVTVASSLCPPAPTLDCHVADVLDAPDARIAPLFASCGAFIHQAREAGKGVLVHCFAGKSRSATVLCAYLMQYCHMPMADALNAIKLARPQVCPNSGFLKQLEVFQQQLIQKGTLSPELCGPVPDWAKRGAAKRAAAHSAEGVQGGLAVAAGHSEPRFPPPTEVADPSTSTRSSGTSTDLGEALDCASVPSPTLTPYDSSPRGGAAEVFDGPDEDGDLVLSGSTYTCMD